MIIDSFKFDFVKNFCSYKPPKINDSQSTRYAKCQQEGRGDILIYSSGCSTGCDLLFSGYSRLLGLASWHAGIPDSTVSSSFSHGEINAPPNKKKSSGKIIFVIMAMFFLISDLEIFFILTHALYNSPIPPLLKDVMEKDSDFIHSF